MRVGWSTSALPKATGAPFSQRRIVWGSGTQFMAHAGRNLAAWLLRINDRNVCDAIGFESYEFTIF